MSQIRIQVELTDLVCRNTEDIFGGDEIYFVGVGLYKPPVDQWIIRGAVNPPISIASGETKPINLTLFDDWADEDTTIGSMLLMRDSDFSNDYRWWRDHGGEDRLTEIEHDLVEAMLGWGIWGLATGDFTPAVIDAIAVALVYGWDQVAPEIDHDDELGRVALTFPARGPAVETGYRVVSKDAVIGFSTWEYSLYWRVTRTPARLIVTVQPSTIAPGQEVQVTVHAVDSYSGTDVSGSIEIDRNQVGRTDVPFSYTFHQRISGVVLPDDSRYPQPYFTFPVQLKAMQVEAQPHPVPVDQQVNVTVNAQDAADGALVSGEVWIDGKIVAATGQEFPYTFSNLFPEDLGDQPVVIYPKGKVTAPDYEDTPIDFGLPPNRLPHIPRPNGPTHDLNGPS
jgi:hypothetical protein